MDPEYNEGDVAEAEDGSGRYMVYRRGEWFPSDSEGVPTVPIPAPEWGDGATELPDGTILGPRGPRGGAPDVLRRGGGGVSGTAPPAITADARNRLVFGISPATRAVERMAEQQEGGVNPLNRDWLAATIDAVPDFGLLNVGARIIGGEDYQQYDQALATMEASLLPIFSGLAVTESEAKRFIRANLPRLGDTPETINEKTRNLQEVVNAGSWLIGRDLPFPEVGIYNQEGLEPTGDAAGPINPQTGLPTYSGIQRLTANARELPLTAAEMGGVDPSKPGGSADTAIDFTAIDPDKLISLTQEGGWIRRGPDGEPYYIEPGSVRRASGEDAPRTGDEFIGNRIVVRPQSPDEATERRRQMDPFARYVDAGVRGIVDSASFGFADEIGAGIGAGLGALTGQEGLREGYQRRVGIERAINAADAQDAGAARFTGQALGALAAPGAMAGGRFIANAPRLGYAMTRGAAVGAAGGGAYGAGTAEGGLAERGRGLMTGAAFGGATGAALPPVMRAVGAIASPVTRPLGNAVSDIARGATGRGLTPDERAARSLLRGQDPQAMRQTADQMRRFGAEPTVADVAGSVVQGRTRVAATRQGPGRQVAEDFSAGRRADIQDFTAGLGRIVSETEATPSQIEGMLEQYQRQASAPAFGAVRGDRIGLDESSVLALRSPEGRKAIKDAANLYLSSTNAEDRAIAAELNRLADDVLDQPGLVQVTVGAADLMSRYLAKAGGVDANRNRVFGGLGRALRQNATEQSPGYEQALTGFAQRARLGDANEIGQRFAGKGSAQDFVSGVRNMGPEGRTIARVAARSGIEQAAETPRGAMSMLDRLAVGRGQNQRAEALLGPEDAATLRQGGRVGRQLVATAQNVNPRAGSNTFLNMADGEEAAGGIMGNVMRGRFMSAAGGALDLIRSAGINDDQAERIVALALDPSRTDEAIQILSTRLAPGVAQRTVAAIQRAANPAISSRTGGEQGRQASMTNPGF